MSLKNIGSISQKIDAKGKIEFPREFNCFINEDILMVKLFNIKNEPKIPFLYLMTNPAEINNFLMNEDNYAISGFKKIWRTSRDKIKMSIPYKYREHAGLKINDYCCLFRKGNHFEVYNLENGLIENERVLSFASKELSSLI